MLQIFRFQNFIVGILQTGKFKNHEKNREKSEK